MLCYIWSPYYKSHTDRVEMVQQRAVRFVLNNYDRYAGVTNMLNWMFHFRRKVQRIKTTYVLQDSKQHGGI